MSKFIITKLRLEGNSLAPAEIELRAGLNVITGPTNTGKSYIFECINYMLGSSKKLRNIVEARQYQRIFLEIKNQAVFYTLESDLDCGSFKLYEQQIKDINHNTTYKILKRKHDQDSKDTISAFLLSLNNLGNKVIRQNANGKTRGLSYRDIIRYLMIDEERIITKDSLIVSPHYSSNTEEISTLKLIVTGHDDSNIISGISEKEIIHSKGKLDLLADLISRLKVSINENELRIDVQAKMDELNSQLVLLQKRHKELSLLVDDLYKERNEKAIFLATAELKLKAFFELLSRSDILERQYISDKERLNATIESGYLLLASSKKEKRICPFCKNKLEEDISDNKIIPIIESCKSEFHKICLLLEELDESKKIIADEKKALEVEISAFKNAIVKINSNIENFFGDEMRKIIDKINKLNDEKEQILVLRSKNKQIELYLRMQEDIKGPISQSRKGKFSTDLTTASTKKLSDCILNILKRSQYPDIANVAYSEKKKDFVLSGEDRGLSGKGLRAITYSAFIIALQELISNLDYSLGVPILDSPLVTYRKPIAEGEEISIDIAMAFYKYLAEDKYVTQMIILENEEPPVEIRNRINYIIFTGNEHGRKGFIPVHVD